MKKELMEENDTLCYWIAIILSNGWDAYDGQPLERPVAVHHLIHRTKSATRWDLDNLFAMKQGNHFKIHIGGEEAYFIAKIIQQRGLDFFTELHNKGWSKCKLSKSYISEVNSELEKTLQELIDVPLEDFKKMDSNKRWEVVQNAWRR